VIYQSPGISRGGLGGGAQGRTDGRARRSRAGPLIEAQRDAVTERARSRAR
jgi:hypothetical protein